MGQISRRDVLRAIQDSTSYNVDNKEINGYITQEMKGSLQIENSEQGILNNACPSF